MERRTFLGIFTGGSFAPPILAEAQQIAAPRIGWLVYGGAFSESSPGLDAAILRGLKERGHVDGHPQPVPPDHPLQHLAAGAFARW